MNYTNLAECPQFTVVNEYVPEIEVGSGAYESEQQLEQRFIRTLEGQGYEYLRNMTSEDALVANLRRQMEKLNHVALRDGAFTDGEWRRFYADVLANPRDHVVEKTEKFQQTRRFSFDFDDGHSDNLMIFDAAALNNNTLQVLNQYEEHEGTREVRYDVTVLVNGLPAVHVELKRRGVAIREAFNQIKRYTRDGFWGGDALFEWVQVFVISNGTETKYYANTTRQGHLREIAQREDADGGTRRTSNSFEFTSYWSDAKNSAIRDLRDFTKTFFAQQTLRNLLARFCVLTVDKTLLVMRPYQIAATERILERVRIASNRRERLGTVAAGGYVWHSTGSGKTLTSFKTAQLATKLDYIDRVLFVVDRQDLDSQTLAEYERFQHGCVRGTTDTQALTEQLSDEQFFDRAGRPVEKSRIVITTIQKLSIFVRNNAPGSRHAGIYQKHVVLIFDECHRSQFGKMHREITKKFRRYHIFGFTGTPIFAVNASTSGDPDMCTTEQAFGDQLHRYTIVDAIADQNVLPFHVETVGSVSPRSGISDTEVPRIDLERAYLQPERVTKIVAYILEHFADKTLRSRAYVYHGDALRGFNSIFAVSSVKAAMAYYAEFKRQVAALPEEHPMKGLKFATIFTYSANEEDPEDASIADGGDVSQLDQTARDFLEGAIGEYNTLFPRRGRTAFGAGSGEQFHNYYMDLSLKMKGRQLDLLIVVNMFLTGFDAPTLNTLWVDKGLKQHGLLQAFSRTNRILNSVKTCGNIVCFRNLEDETNRAISLYGDGDAGGIVRIKTFGEYYSDGYEDARGNHVRGYVELVADLQERFPLGTRITGEDDIREFVRLFGAILRRINMLRVFDAFAEDREAKQILTDRELQDYQSVYLDFYDQMRNATRSQAVDINDDIVFEMDTIRQFDVNIDYILRMVDQYHASNCRDRDLLEKIRRAMDGSARLRSKRELINAFVDSYNQSAGGTQWAVFVATQLAADVRGLAERHGMDYEATRSYLVNALRVGSLLTTGEGFDAILPPTSLFGGEAIVAASEAIRRAVAADLQMLFDRYDGVYVDMSEYYSATPDAFWKSGRTGELTPVPPGYCAYVIMLGECYDAVESGEKRIEYRDASPRNIAMFRNNRPVAIRFAYGYTSRQMCWEVERVEDGRRDFDIHLGKRLW